MRRAVVLGAAARAELAVYRAAACGYRWLIAMWAACAPLAPERRVVLRERLGHWPAGGRPPAGRAHETQQASDAVWIHAASAGEVGAARPLVEAIRREHPGARLLLTCNTPTGRAAARAMPVDEIRYFPVDHPPVVERVIERVRPSLFVFVETEIWPGLLLALAGRGIATAMVNARISARSFPRYRKAGALMGAVLGTVTAVCARDRASRERLLALGADPARTVLAGDIKLDAVAARAAGDVGAALTGIAPEVPVLLAASTRPGEEPIVLAAFESVREEFSTVRLVIAPRHVERSAAVMKMIESRGLRAVAWTRHRPDAGSRDWDVLVVDTAGELLSFMRAAVGAFVGGTLVPVGGHNVLEPAAFGLPVVTGPYVANVAEQVDGLRASGALTVASDAAALARAWHGWLDDRTAAAERGRRGRRFIEANRGALARTMERLAPLLEAVVDRRG